MTGFVIGGLPQVRGLAGIAWVGAAIGHRAATCKNTAISRRVLRWEFGLQRGKEPLISDGVRGDH